MKPSSHGWQRRVVEAAVAFGLVAYFTALHLLIVDARWPRVTVLIVVAPWSIALALLAWRRLPRVAALVAVALLAVTTVVASGWASAFPEQTVLFESLTFNLVIASVFAASLVGSGEALITRLARIARRGDVPPRVVVYTRRVTVAWAVFFVACAATSALLYVKVSHEAWSVFANLLYWPLVVLMFIAEYVVRRIVLSDLQHVSLMTSVRTYAQSQHKGTR